MVLYIVLLHDLTISYVIINMGICLVSNVAAAQTTLRRVFSARRGSSRAVAPRQGPPPMALVTNGRGWKAEGPHSAHTWNSYHNSPLMCSQRAIVRGFLRRARVHFLSLELHYRRWFFSVPGHLSRPLECWQRARSKKNTRTRGNHLSNTACLTQVIFKSGE